MLASRRLAGIIGALLVVAALAGCALRLGYGNAPTLLFWWIDGYVDVTDAQRPALRDAIARWFRWHRAVELPKIVALLERTQGQAMQPTTPQAVCALVDEARRRYEVALTQALPDAAALVRTLEPAQLEHLERKFSRADRAFRDEHLPRDVARRREVALERALDRAEQVYGPLSRVQREELAHDLAASPFDPERRYDERVARQRDIAHTLRAMLAAPRMPPAQAQAELAALAQRLLHSPRAEYRDHQARAWEHNCAMVARLHNRSTAEQRAHARDKLASWADDLRALAEF